MDLRRQLLFIAPLTLALPWAGCEYVRDMQANARQNHQHALDATAQAIAARFLSDPSFTSNLHRNLSFHDSEKADGVLYAYPLTGAVVLDGYADEWRHITEKSEQDKMIPYELWGVSGDSVYGFIRVVDAERRFFQPTKDKSEIDHLLLTLGSWSDSGAYERREYRLFTAAPGPIWVERHFGYGLWQREHRISGVWTEVDNGYAVEIKLPLEWATQGLSLVVRDDQQTHALPYSKVSALIKETPEFSADLHVFLRDGIRLSLVSPDGWVLGQAGQLSYSQSATSNGGWIWQKILGDAQFPALAPTLSRYQLSGARPSDSSDPLLQSGWFKDSGYLLGRIVMPLEQTSALLVVEKLLDADADNSSHALGRLLWYSLIASVIASGGLLMFASILSWRIRRLSQAAQKAVDGDGRIRQALPSSRRRDEIGDLARAYAALLERMSQYNQYLEQLAGRLSHELRTPLAIVRSSLENISQVQSPDEQRVYLARASEGLDRLTQLLNAMSAASRLEQTMQHHSIEQVDLRDFVKEIVAVYATVYQPRTIQFVYRTEGPFIMRGAPDLLAQMLDKLVENAADFTGKNGDVEFLLTRSGRFLILQVSNSGPPISAEIEGRLFDSLTSSRKGQGSHLGLGLYVVKMIVQFHKGRVRAFNQPEKNRVAFEIAFPAL